jgi:hypothetical protein
MIDTVRSLIKEGVEDAYFKDKALRESFIELQTPITEYLFTVHVAMKLLGWQHPQPGGRFLTHIEYGAAAFLNNAFERFKLNPYRRRRKHHTLRSGRIDIAILELASHLSVRSVMGIELKGINPPMTKVDADITRLAHAMRAHDRIGENSIRASFSAYVVRLNRKGELFEACQAEPRICGHQAALTEHFARLLRRGNGIQSRVDVWAFDIRGATEVANGMPADHWDAKEIASQTGAVAGVLVTLVRA